MKWCPLCNQVLLNPFNLSLIYTWWSSSVSRNWLYIFVALGLSENRSKKNTCWSKSRLVSSLWKLSTMRDCAMASGSSDVHSKRSFIQMICDWMLCKITGCDTLLEEPGAGGLILHFHAHGELGFLSDTSETEQLQWAGRCWWSVRTR